MKILDKLADLVNVKTVITFVVVAVFAILALRESVSPEVTMTVVTMVVSFYFGTQHEKQNPAKDETQE